LYLVLPDVTRWQNTTDTFTAVLSNAQLSWGTAGYTKATHTMHLISEGNTTVVPSGMNYELVVIAVKNGTYYYYEQSGAIPSGGLIATATLTVKTQSDITAALQGL
jgi:hypothetical protein